MRKPSGRTKKAQVECLLKAGLTYETSSMCLKMYQKHFAVSKIGKQCGHFCSICGRQLSLADCESEKSESN